MKQDSRLSGVLHLLLHMADADDPLTSEMLARMMQTNPVVVRRELAGLRRAGLVSSQKGHGGGWRLARDPATVTLYDVYAALGSPELLALGNRSKSPGCLVETAVNRTMNGAFAEAEALLQARFREVTLAELGSDVGQGMRAWRETTGHYPHTHKHHSPNDNPTGCQIDPETN